ncbi:DUF3892 domain-containing protein [Tsukamurella conjunctivitidis]|uniref:DUF3892 domain-containing protein n=1 Tax=Tsukamurella conjunctivitidis TaxID=2592068 RepID=A0A5C5RZJ7_9ACTN|nr:DUF3892 domain-containing protein [Tsukamurella conjunctivitidis]
MSLIPRARPATSEPSATARSRTTCWNCAGSDPTAYAADRPAYLQSKANGVLNDNLLSLPEVDLR